VSNSRIQKRNNQIWRRRACLDCGTTFTTHELAFLPDLFMVDKSGALTPFEPSKLLIDLSDALKHRQDRYVASRELTAIIINKFRSSIEDKPVLSARDIAKTTADTLRHFDKRGWQRFVADYAYLES